VNKPFCSAIAILVFCCLGLKASAQYSPAIQQQMNAAGAQQSSAVNPTYPTPLATFQTFFSSVQNLNISSLCGTFTNNGLTNLFDGYVPSSPSDYTNLATKMGANNPRNYVLTAFVFHADATRPTISVSFSHLVTANGNTAKISENATLTLVDSAQGWLIDDWSN